jgi:Alternative oxidase
MIIPKAYNKVFTRGLHVAMRPSRLTPHQLPKPGLCDAYFKAMKAKKTSPTAAVSSCDPYYQYMKEIMSVPGPTMHKVRMFSTDARPAIAQLQHLDASVVATIKSELKTVDSNQDGMMQPEEFRKLLRMHSKHFDEREIDLVTECFYSGTGGRGVSLDRFLEALDVAAKNPEDPDKVAKTLGISACGAEYILGSKTHAYTAEELNIQLTHKVPEKFTNKLSFQAVKAVRYLFDAATGWRGEIKPRNVMNRVIYLETIAAVPGMVAGIIRHFKSLRAMERDGGMLNMFLEEALNERMHLLTFVKMKDPGMLMRAAVLGGQVGFGAFYGLAYVISPKFCHSFVGYVEEEACATYTKIIQAIEGAPEGSEIAAWKTELAPQIGRAYWHLGENGTVLDLMYAIRADEAEHRDVNHYASDMKKGDLAPVGNPKKQIDLALKKYVRDLMTV